MSMDEQISFVGKGWSFPPTFIKNAATVVLASDEKDINDSLAILLTTSIGERMMQPKYGCNLKDYIYEPATITLQAYLKDLIKKAILYFEPRIRLEQVGLDADSNEGKITISVTYSIRSTNSRNNFVFPFYIKEGTAINR